MRVRAAGQFTINWGAGLGGAVGTVGGRVLGVGAGTLSAAGVTIDGTVSDLVVPLHCFVVVLLVAR